MATIHVAVRYTVLYLLLGAFLAPLYGQAQSELAEPISALNNAAEPKNKVLSNSQDEPSIEVTEQTIDTDVPTGSVDDAIKTRITDILAVSTKFRDFSVEVDKGLVFLAGIAVESQYVDWAGDLSRQVDGVVGVINDIKVPEVELYSWEPVKQAFSTIWLEALAFLPLLIFGLLTFSVFFFLAKPLSSWLALPVGFITDSLLLKVVIRRTISVLIILFGLYFFLIIAGLGQFAVAILSGTGVLGLVIGFAFRDIAENFISSLLISVQRPFRLGDVIEVNGNLGVVHKVTARGTTLLDFDGNHIQIPNSDIYKNVIKNYTANPNMRGNFLVGVGYDSSAKDAQSIALEFMAGYEAVLKHPEPQVLIEELGSSTYQLRVYFWVNSEVHSILKVGSALMRELVNEFESSGISMPDDAREIVFPQGAPFVINQRDTDSLNKQKTDDFPRSELFDNKTNINKSKTTHLKRKEHVEQDEDVSSDTKVIHEQASKAREPEEGENII